MEIFGYAFKVIFWVMDAFFSLLLFGGLGTFATVGLLLFFIYAGVNRAR